MSEYLKGNYKLDVTIDTTPDGEESSATSDFEKKALARLGGSICFVSKKGFLWKGDAASTKA